MVQLESALAARGPSMLEVVSWVSHRRSGPLGWGAKDSTPRPFKSLQESLRGFSFAFLRPASSGSRAHAVALHLASVARPETGEPTSEPIFQAHSGGAGLSNEMPLAMQLVIF